VYSGEHYVFDVLLGWLYALIVVLVLRRVRPPVQPMPAENPLTTPAPSSA
jgi:membrane-associated phospholipid phosphatase